MFSCRSSLHVVARLSILDAGFHGCLLALRRADDESRGQRHSQNVSVDHQVVEGRQLPPDVVKARIRHLAQWAINVADYRDPDNIMTAFEYDENPFDGWLPDGDLRTAVDVYGTDKKFGGTDDIGGVVWGLERPEVLMTETLSWHDRATEDRGVGFEDAVTDENGDGKMDMEDGGEVGTLSDTGHDTDFDQRVRPQGATFIELYNPHPILNRDTILNTPIFQYHPLELWYQQIPH